MKDDLIRRSDAIEQKRGEWRLVTPKEYRFEGYRCSECNELVYGKTNFCPNCGADMRAKQTEPKEVRCPKCGSTDYIKSLKDDYGIKNSGYEYKCINCNTYIKPTDCPWK